MLGRIGCRRRRGLQRMRWLDGRESEWTLGVGDGQGGLVCFDSWGRKELDTTEWLHFHFHFANKGTYSQSYGFYSSHVWMWELDHKENWSPKNSCFWTVVLEKTLESPLDSKEIKPVNPKGNQSWIFIGRTDAEALTLWPLDAKSWLIRKTLMLGKIGGRRIRGWQRIRWLDGITD